MLVAAAVSVNKAICGRSLLQKDKTDTQPAVVYEAGETVIHTAECPGVITGFGGAVPLDIYIKDGKIDEVRALPNSETPSFFRKASSILSSWDGLPAEEALHREVDGVSGATYSSAAIINNVRCGLSAYTNLKAENSRSIPLRLWVCFAVILIACIVPLFVKNKIYHNVQLIVNIIVLGFWCGVFLDYSLILQTLSFGFSLPGGLCVAVMLIAAFIYPLFGHPQHYCSYICPLGSAQQLMGEIWGHKIHIPAKTIKALDWFRRILWAVLMLMLWTDCLTEWMDLELFQAFRVETASWWIIGAALLFILLSAVVSRPYCRFVCPTGSLFKRSENLG